MARATGRYRQLLCHSCNQQWGAVVWVYSDDWYGDKTLPTCTCPIPHVEVLPRPGDLHYARCRASQRFAYYELPDGTVCAPETNSYEDPGALAAISRGGVRHEVHSVREMGRLHRDWQPSDYDPSVAGRSGWGENRNLVLDYDQHTIRSRQAKHPLRVRVDEQMGPQHNPFRPQTTEGEGSVFRILPNDGTYERARAEYERRGRG